MRWIMAVLVLAAAPCYADDAADLCKAYADLAETMMQGRQSGVSMVKAMEVAGDNKPAQELVMIAYDRPRMSLPENQRREVEDFRDQVYLTCLKAKR